MKKREMNQEDASQLLTGADSGAVSSDSGEPNFIEKNGKLISIVSLVVVVAIAVAFYLRYQSEEASGRASVLLTRVMEYYEAGDYEKALNGDPSKTYLGEEVKGLKYIADEFSSTDQGKIAALYAANSLFNSNKQSDSKKYFEIAQKSSADIIRLGANAGLAATLEIENKYSEAAELYKSASQYADEDNIKSRYLFYSALCYEKAENSAQAESLYREILKLSEFGEFSTLAKAGLTRIGTIIE
ncbi:MAG: tetratricopeptide repeat protein [Candidatus Kapabacteria bacterium]|nr:tetratricopeptide repeat protein [Ignavibacteriota bacterium]MCW5884307.1 tetratricopeptide repeat protein [Candidatus Kapabacteria bacterium]